MNNIIVKGAQKRFYLTTSMEVPIIRDDKNEQKNTSNSIGADHN
jgi:hypothetical protein